MTDRNSKPRKLGKRAFAISNVAAVAIVVIIIAAAAIGAYGIYGLGNGGGTGTGSSVTSSVQSSIESSIHTGSSSIQSSTGTGSHSGQLSILVSDPPHLPNNASALYITYPNMFVHTQGLPDGEGWVQVSSSGSIQLLGAVDIGLTIASASIPAGVYNMLRFNVSSAAVTYNSQNYTAYVQNGNLTIKFITSLTVDPSQPSAVIVDIQPFVYNFGTLTNPSFVLKPTALCFLVPQESLTPQMHNVGNRYQFYANNTWFWRYRNAYYPNINITSATLSNVSLTAAIANPSNQTATIKAITVTALQTSSGGQGRGTSYGSGFSTNATTPGGLSGSAVFLVLPNGTLTQPTRAQYSGTPLNLSSLIWGGAGYELASGASVTLSYSGTIQLSLRMSPNVAPGEIISGQQYLISMVGDDVCASFVVTAN
ncbi:MAG: DUF4382 domain-containing protein [Thaumarchaeota archaeon]|nr:DUF4382 domain-containing protein [Nitrososphaerota archaeon]MDG6905475.1 DUF4382 domain-containing protein [Nitrososphaerota archaeon]